VCIKRKCKWLGRRDELQREAEAPKIDWKRNLPAGSMPASLIVQAAGNTVQVRNIIKTIDWHIEIGHRRALAACNQHLSL